MRSRESSLQSWDLLWYAAPLPALAAIIVAITVESVPLLTIATVVLVAYGGLLAGATEERKASASQRAAIFEAEGELVYALRPAHALATVEVAASSGRCPRGYRPGHAWFIGPGGTLSQPICRPAAQVLDGAFQVMAASGEAQKTACHCPLTGHSDVSFVLQAA